MERTQDPFSIGFRARARMTVIALHAVLCSGLVAGTVPATAQPKIYVYPQKGQSADQQRQDEAECHTWAIKESGVNPAAPAAGPDRGRRAGGAVGGAARGAALGAAVGAIAGDAGKGAAAGAAVGGVGGRRRAVREEQAAAGAEQGAYVRAYGACLEGRGYSVK